MDQNWATTTLSHFESILNLHLHCPQAHPQLIEAMRYSALNAGKRIRPLLCYATGHIFNTPLSKLDDYAAALEMIHVYSLIHDDLPAMDNDDLRRGKPTCHKAFNEATAILAGDGLLTYAFLTLANAPLSAEIKIKLIQLLSDQAGLNGMVNGQMMDIQSENKTITLDELQQIHAQKTGALIKASILGAALCSNQANTSQLQQLSIFAKHLGLAFQIQDDVLDIESNSAILGKTAGKDRVQNKATYPALLGFDTAKKAAAEHVNAALNALTDFDSQAEQLRGIARYVITRNY